MSRKFELILPLILAAGIAVTGIWFFTNNIHSFLYYNGLSQNGVETGAVLAKKGILIDGLLFKNRSPEHGGSYHFVVSFSLSDGTAATCGFDVSANTYNAISVRDQLYIIYPPDNPGRCTLPYSIEANKLLSLSVLAISVFLILIAFGLMYYIYVSFKKPPVPPELTTDLDIGNNTLTCPRCGGGMDEGYIPTVGGISWRDRGEAVGIPTMLTGLPGTTFWLKRPMLHAFRCEDCGIITFRYSNKK